jgi:hypothetical protein
MNKKYIPQYSELQFESEKKYKQWLMQNAHATLLLKDRGQDMQYMCIHKTGEILDVDFHKKLYIGKFINMNKMQVNNFVEIYDEKTDEFKEYSLLAIHEIVINQSQTAQSQ